ncbi:MAG: threonine aldolase family protein [Fibrobacterota bacterium]
MNIAQTSNQQFASDNYSGICPEALQMMIEANVGHHTAYGDDMWTQRASDMIREMFETDCEVFFVFNGTAANSLSLASLCDSFNSIICHQFAHIETDECGSPEFFTHGAKLLSSEGPLGKLKPETVEKIIHRRSDIHYPRPRVLSLTQSTEFGTVYTIDEVSRLCSLAHDNGLRVHMDGARFANAVASLGCTPAAITWKAGLDVLCFGGTKNGLSIGEAIVFFDKSAARNFDCRCKQAGQLASKMRFISAPWVGLLENGTWLRNAEHANSCAADLSNRLTGINGIEMMYPCEANAVFVSLPSPAVEYLQKQGWNFYTFIGLGGARLMCSWDTQPGTIDRFVTDVGVAVGG